MKKLYSLLIVLSVTAVATAEIKVETVMVSMRDGVHLATATESRNG
jgi:predicted acyl esterase